MTAGDEPAQDASLKAQPVPAPAPPARRGTYRIIHRIDEAKRVVEIHSIRHRRDAYRS